MLLSVFGQMWVALSSSLFNLGIALHLPNTQVDLSSFFSLYPSAAVSCGVTLCLDSTGRGYVAFWLRLGSIDSYTIKSVSEATVVKLTQLRVENLFLCGRKRILNCIKGGAILEKDIWLFSLIPRSWNTDTLGWWFTASVVCMNCFF